MTTIIGLIGRAGAGKDTLAGYLNEFGFRRVSVAEPIYRAALIINPLINAAGGEFRGGFRHARLGQLVDLMGWDDAKRLLPDVRRTLQNVGQALREIDPDLLDNLVKERIADAILDGLDVVITDVRPPDMRLMAELDAFMVRVQRIARPDVGTPNHPSEDVEAIDVDLIVTNGAGLDALALEAWGLAERFGKAAGCYAR